MSRFGIKWEPNIRHFQILCVRVCLKHSQQIQYLIVNNNLHFYAAKEFNEAIAHCRQRDRQTDRPRKTKWKTKNYIFFFSQNHLPNVDIYSSKPILINANIQILLMRLINLKNTQTHTVQYSKAKAKHSYTICDVLK